MLYDPLGKLLAGIIGDMILRESVRNLAKSCCPAAVRTSTRQSVSGQARASLSKAFACRW